MKAIDFLKTQGYKNKSGYKIKECQNEKVNNYDTDC